MLGGTFYQAAGGKGANQAVAAARAGKDPVVFIAAVGDDEFGRASRQALSRENMICDYIQTIPGAASGVDSTVTCGDSPLRSSARPAIFACP